MNDTDRRNFLKQGVAGAAAFSIHPDLATLDSPPTLTAPVKLALIGTGRQGRAILSELSKFKQVQTVAVCDVDAPRLRSSLRRAKGAKSYPDHHKLLDEEKNLDAIVVATPTHLHKAIAIDAMARKLHVYCEAPLASTIEDARAIAAAARTSRKVFQTGMLGRANPIYQLARSFVRSGAIGDVVSMQGHWHKKNSWRTPASDKAREKALNWKLDPAVTTGLAGEFATQQMDVVHWFTGKYPMSVSGRGAVMGWDDGRTVHDTIHCQFGFPDGLGMSYAATLCNSFAGQFELLSGTLGTVKLAWTHAWMFKEADASTQGWEVYANREQFHNDEGITLIADATKLAKQGKLEQGVGLPHPTLYYALEGFLKSVTEDKQVICSADEGLRAAVVGILTHTAVTSGKTQTIDAGLLRPK